MSLRIPKDSKNGRSWSRLTHAKQSGEVAWNVETELSTVDLANEIQRLNNELAKTRIERDYLKKTVRRFAKQSVRESAASFGLAKQRFHRALTGK